MEYTGLEKHSAVNIQICLHCKLIWNQYKAASSITKKIMLSKYIGFYNVTYNTIFVLFQQHNMASGPVPLHAKAAIYL